MPGTSRREELRKELLQMQQKRSDLEKEIIGFNEILKTQNMGMDESLVDNEGFPRSDVNLYQVRTARNKIVCLTNDCKQLTLEMEKKLYEIHALDRESLNFYGKLPLNDSQNDKDTIK